MLYSATSPAQSGAMGISRCFGPHLPCLHAQGSGAGCCVVALGCNIHQARLPSHEALDRTMVTLRQLTFLCFNYTSTDPKQHGQKYMGLASLASFEFYIALSHINGCCVHDILPIFYKQDFNGACVLK